MQSNYLNGAVGLATILLTRAVGVSAPSAVGTFSITGVAGQIDNIGTTPPPTLFTSGIIPFNTSIDQTAQDLIDHINLTAFDGATAAIVSSNGTTVIISLTLPNSYDSNTFSIGGSGGMTLAQVTPMTAPAGVPFTARKLSYSAFVTGDDKISISQFLPGENFDAEADELPTFREGNQYSIAEITAEFAAKLYNVVILSGDEGYQRVSNGIVTMALGWTLDWSNATKQFTFAVTADTSTYPDGVRVGAVALLKDSFGNVMHGQVGGAGVQSITFPTDTSKAFFDNAQNNVELVVIFNSDLGDYQEVRFTDVDMSTVISSGITGDEASWS